MSERDVAAILVEHATFGWDGDAHHRCRCGAILNDKPTAWAIPPWALHVAALLCAVDDEEFCPDCFAGMESDQHREACTLGRGPWPGRLS